MASNERKWALIQPYVTFTYRQYKRVRRKGKAVRKLQKPTPATKRKVDKYFQLIYGGRTKRFDPKNPNGEGGIASGPTYHWKKKLTKQQRAVAFDYAHIPHKGYEELRGVIIPVAHDGHKPKLHFEVTASGVPELVVGEGNVDTHYLRFVDYENESGESIDDIDPVLNRALRDAEGARKFNLVCGRHDGTVTYDRAQLKAKVHEIYNSDRYQEPELWMTGVIARKFKRTMSWKKFKKDLSAGKVFAKQKAQAARRGRAIPTSPATKRGRKKRHEPAHAPKRLSKPSTTGRRGKSHTHTGKHARPVKPSPKNRKHKRQR